MSTTVYSLFSFLVEVFLLITTKTPHVEMEMIFITTNVIMEWIMKA